MATTQMMRDETKQSNWASIFPPEQATEIKSTLFVKKLLAVAVSSITYLRALFPENAFGDRCLEDVHLKILRDDSSYPGACKVIQWLRGCFDALEKKYLRAVLIGVYEDPDDPNTVIEEYSFKFSYGDGEGMDIYRNGAKILSANSDGEQTDKEIKKSTIRLLRTIVLLSQTLTSLPDNVMMAMKLLYYDEVTPEDYNPPGFKGCEAEEFDFKEEPINIKAGQVSTNFHSLKLRVKTLHNDLQIVNDDIVKEAVVPSDVEDMIKNSDAGFTNIASLYPALDENSSIEKTEEVIEDEIQTESADENSMTTNIHLGTPASSVAQCDNNTEEATTLCSCGVHEDDGMMILCASCNTWQHAICYAITNSKDAPEPHYCVDCAKKYDYQCTDKQLAQIEDTNKISENCLWRRALISVAEVNRVLPTTLSKRLMIPVNVASNLIKRMEAEGFVQSGGKGKRFGKLVQNDKIMGYGMDTYFHYIINVDSVIEKASNMQISEQQQSEILKDDKRKHQISPLDEPDLKFEISNSQSESPLSHTSNTRKRRKTSVPVNPIVCN